MKYLTHVVDGGNDNNDPEEYPLETREKSEGFLHPTVPRLVERLFEVLTRTGVEQCQIDRNQCPELAIGTLYYSLRLVKHTTPHRAGSLERCRCWKVLNLTQPFDQDQEANVVLRENPKTDYLNDVILVGNLTRAFSPHNRCQRI